MKHVGAQLKEAREAQHKTRADVARDTGILIHDLAALEYGSYDDLPDDRTAAGFVKSYAEYLGFRPDEPVAEFWAERGVEAPPEAVEAGPAAPVETGETPRTEPAGPPRRGLWPWVLVGAAVVLLVVVWLVSGGDDQPRTVVPDSTPAVVETDASPPEAARPAPERAEPEAEPEPTAPAPVERTTPRPEPAGPATTPATVPASTLRVTEHGVGTGVRNRGLVGESDRFAAGGRVWFWTRVQGGDSGDEIRHVWIHAGREVATVRLRVGSANWRTQSNKSMFASSVGRWAVEARDAAGRVLARDEFSIEP